MRLDLVAVAVTIDHGLGKQGQIGCGFDLVAASADFEARMQAAPDRTFDLARGQHLLDGLPERLQFRFDALDMPAIETERHAAAGARDRLITLIRNASDHIPVEGSRKNLAED